ncbi:GDP-mannose 4,6-dehydratase [Sporomusa acidovorans]|uniref:GDP-mannose 4,6-dehydratase n=1 Tax=Sporomusa acidovorans TaxID=112900 RepID=UPI001FE0588F|nr:GDP-mannose 4,6-dehydratase [Sporomusa acidovorans]
MKTFEEANDIAVLYEIVDRRPGDIAECYADATKAGKELQWKAKRDIVAMCRDAWRFECQES